MRILQAHNRHATRGGADDVMDRERNLLTAAGHQVEQFLVAPASESGMTSWQQGAAATWNRQATHRLAERLEAFRPDVLHVHTPFPLMSPMVFRVAHRHDVATVSTVHSFRYSCIAGTLRRDGRICEDCVGSRIKTAGVVHGCYHGSRVQSAALALSLSVHHVGRTLSNHVDRYLPLTQFAKDLLVRDGIPPEHITVKPNCMDDPSPLTPYRDRQPYVLFVGRLVEEKGVRTLLEAWQLAAPSGVRLRIAGDGALRPLVEETADQDPSIEFLGWRASDEIEKLQQEAMLTVVPSEWYEAGPPLVLLQALASGTPVLCCDLANICDGITDAGAALSFATGSRESLSGRLRHMLDGSTDLSSMAAAARAVYERQHTPASTVSTLERVYEEVVR